MFYWILYHGILGSVMRYLLKIMVHKFQYHCIFQSSLVLLSGPWYHHSTVLFVRVSIVEYIKVSWYYTYKKQNKKYHSITMVFWICTIFKSTMV